MAQIKRAVGSLTEKEKKELTVVAITLDPERDNPEALRKMAGSQGVSAPLYNLVTGKAEKVNKILDLYGFTRRRNPKTGVIDHVNLFVLIDRKGKIAYRFNLGKEQEEWLKRGLKVLLAEPGVKIHE